MPSINLILTDTPNGSVSIKSDFTPAVGHPISAAQAHALDMIARTHKQWGMQQATTSQGIDIDAVHRTRDNVIQVQP